MHYKTCCFTGHRRLPSEEIPALQKRLEEEIRRLYREDFHYFAAGGALGFDTLAALAVLFLRDELPGLRLILVLPCLDQTCGWPPQDVGLYDFIKRRADKVVYTGQGYTPGCMHRRNRTLVEGSQCCLSYLTRRSGGTFYTVEYCRKKGVPVINLGAEL